MKSLARRMSSLLGVLLVAIGVMAAMPSRAEMKEVRIGVQPGLPSLPVIIALEKGFFAKEADKAGLGDRKFTLQRVSGADAVMEALRSESLEASVLGATAFLSAWDKTRGREDVRALAPIAVLDVTLYTNKPEIKSFTDFGNDDRIAVPANASPQAMLMRMAAAKFQRSDQIGKLLVVMPHPEATAALLAGKTITGYVASQPFSMVLSKSGKAHAVITSKEILDGTPATGAVIAAGSKFVGANPELVKAMIAALEDAMAFIRADPGAAADVYIRFDSSRISREDLVQQLTDGSMVYSMTPSGFMTFARFMAKSGQLGSEPASWQDLFFPFLHAKGGS